MNQLTNAAAMETKRYSPVSEQAPGASTKTNYIVLVHLEESANANASDAHTDAEAGTATEMP